MEVQSHSSSNQSQQYPQQNIPQHDISNLPTQKLFELAQKKYQELDYQTAQQFYSIAYKKDPLNQNVVLCYANLLKQMDKSKKAKKILQTSIQNQPKGNSAHKRYFQLAQLYDGQEAIKCFQKGIKQANQTLNNPFANQSQPQQQQIKEKPKKSKKKKNKDSNPLASLIKQTQQMTMSNTKLNSQNQFVIQTRNMIASAYASIAEICLTQLIDIPAAQTVCLNSLKKGQQFDPKCLDIQLNWGTYLLAKEDDESAAKRILALHSNLLKLKATQQKHDSQFVSQLPYQLSLQNCRQLIEIQKFKECIQLLQVINDQIASGKQAQVLYFLVFCYFKLQQYQKCQQYIYIYEDSKQDCKEIDLDIQNEVQQMIKQIKKKKGKINKNNKGDTGSDMQIQGSDQQWEDMDEDQKM